MYSTQIQTLDEMPEARTIHVRGSVTLEEAPEFRDEVLGEVARTAASKVVLELAGIDRMDTSGAAVLAEALKVGESRGLRVLLCSPSEPVMRIFRLAGFEEVLGACCADPAETYRRLIE